MRSNISKFTLRIDTEMLLKFRYVAEYNGRSANRELDRLIRKQVSEFEKTIEKVPSDWLEEKKQYLVHLSYSNSVVVRKSLFLGLNCCQGSLSRVIPTEKKLEKGIFYD